jgi:hypothetical protein
MKPRWLDRRIAAPGPYLTLCLSEKEYDSAMRTLGIKHYGTWISENANATAHNLNNANGDLCSVVCLSSYKKRTSVEIAGLLVHEAVHIWQEYCDFYGEDKPGREQEAYAIQFIAHELMTEFARRIGT